MQYDYSASTWSPLVRMHSFIKLLHIFTHEFSVLLSSIFKDSYLWFLLNLLDYDSWRYSTQLFIFLFIFSWHFDITSDCLWNVKWKKMSSYFVLIQYFLLHKKGETSFKILWIFNEDGTWILLCDNFDIYFSSQTHTILPSSIPPQEHPYPL